LNDGSDSISKLVLELFEIVYACTSSGASAAKSRHRVLFSDIYQENTDFVFCRSNVKEVCHKWDASGTLVGCQFRPAVVTRRDGNFGRSDQGYGTKRNRTPIRILHVLSFAGVTRSHFRWLLNRWMQSDVRNFAHHRCLLPSVRYRRWIDEDGEELAAHLIDAMGDAMCALPTFRQ
jgi:hypothetical protein